MASSRARLILVRHGESVLGRTRRYAGHRDTPLTPAGRRQVLRLRSRFESLQPELIVSSDLRRCRETADLLAPNRDVKIAPQLRELDFGAWEGLTARTCQRRDPERFDRWMRDPRHTRPPEGETLTRLWTRVRAFVASLVKRYPGRTLALITHAGPIRAIAAHDASRFWNIDVPPASIMEIVWTERRCPGT